MSTTHQAPIISVDQAVADHIHWFSHLLSTRLLYMADVLEQYAESAPANSDPQARQLLDELQGHLLTTQQLVAPLGDYPVVASLGQPAQWTLGAIEQALEHTRAEWLKLLWPALPPQPYGGLEDEKDSAAE